MDGQEDWCQPDMDPALYFRAAIHHEYGVRLSNSCNFSDCKKWGVNNMVVVYHSLINIDGALNGTLKSRIGGATFMLAEHHPTAEEPYTTYHGWTAGTNVTFFTTGNQVIRRMNVYHEFGHVLDSLPGADNVFSSAVDHPSFVGGDGYLNPGALVDPGGVYDPNYGDAEAIQASAANAQEQWADAFANYVAGNVNLADPTGAAMYNFVTDSLFDAPVGSPPAIMQ